MWPNNQPASGRKISSNPPWLGVSPDPPSLGSRAKVRELTKKRMEARARSLIQAGVVGRSV